MFVVRKAEAREVLGDALLSSLQSLGEELQEWNAQYEHAVVRSWELATTTRARLETTLQRDDSWVFVTLGDSDKILAFDEPSVLGERRPSDAVVYPELSSRLWAWWLAHAWRAGELASESLSAIDRWSLASAATLTRSLLEEVAALSYEARQISDAWRESKALKAGPQRPSEVRNRMHMPLLKAFRGTRLSGAPKGLEAVNVMTLIDRLARDTGHSELRQRYDWLSEAAHPAFAAGTTYASVMFVHDSGAVNRTIYARSPAVIEAGPEQETINNKQFTDTVDCVRFCTRVLLDIGPQIHALVHDVDQTTQSHLLTRTVYIEGLENAPRSDACGCADKHSHDWGSPAPAVSVQKYGLP